MAVITLKLAAGSWVVFGKGGIQNHDGDPQNATVAAFLTDLADTWTHLGKQALIACAIFDTPTFCKLGVGLMPKQLEIENNRPEADLSDEELEMLYQDSLSRLRAKAAGETETIPPAAIAPGSQRVN